MGGSVGKSESSSGNQFGQNVFNPGGQERMQNQLGGLWNQGQAGRGMMNRAEEGMRDITNTARPAWEQQMGGGAYQGMDLQNQYNQALQGGGNEQFMNQSIMGGAGNDYVDAMKGQMQTDAGNRLGQQMAGLDARAGATGMPGSSRHGIVQAQAMDDSNRALTDAQTRLGYETFDQDLDRKMGIAQRADQFDMDRLNNVSGMLGAQQGAMQSGLGASQNMQGLNMGQFAPQTSQWNNANQYSNAMGSPTVLSQGQASSDSKGSGISGGMGGGK